LVSPLPKSVSVYNKERFSRCWPYAQLSAAVQYISQYVNDPFQEWL